MYHPWKFIHLNIQCRILVAWLDNKKYCPNLKKRSYIWKKHNLSLITLKLQQVSTCKLLSVIANCFHYCSSLTKNTDIADLFHPFYSFDRCISYTHEMFLSVLLPVYIEFKILLQNSSISVAPPGNYIQY